MAVANSSLRWQGRAPQIVTVQALINRHCCFVTEMLNHLSKATDSLAMKTQSQEQFSYLRSYIPAAKWQELVSSLQRQRSKPQPVWHHLVTQTLHPTQAEPVHFVTILTCWGHTFTRGSLGEKIYLHLCSHENPPLLHVYNCWAPQQIARGTLKTTNHFPRYFLTWFTVQPHKVWPEHKRQGSKDT